MYRSGLQGNRDDGMQDGHRAVRYNHHGRRFFATCRPITGSPTSMGGHKEQDPADLGWNLKRNNQTGTERMGLFTKDIKSMDNLFLHVMQDIFYAENQIVKALPTMIDKATNRDLAAAFKNHLGETEKQVQRLEQAFELIGEKPSGTSCPAIDGIIKEANEIAGEIEDKKVLDAALLAAAQAVEHYEITRYGTLIAWADELNKAPVAKLLTTTLKEEKAADKKLTTIAERKVNLKAAGQA
jgi:ferritin-like metal-binding protein YciE